MESGADRKNAQEVMINVTIVKFPVIAGYGTLCCNFLLSRTAQHPKLLNPADLMDIQSPHCFPRIFYWDWHFAVTSNDDLRFKCCKDGH